MSTPFSLLCLILLTHFHKNANFRPNMLNCLKRTFTFGKETKDNFINRKVQGRRTCSFIYNLSCPVTYAGSFRGGGQVWSQSCDVTNQLQGKYRRHNHSKGVRGMPPGKFCKIPPKNTRFCAFWKQVLDNTVLTFFYF